MDVPEEELVRKFIFEVGRTPTLLSLAMNFVMKYELDEVKKQNMNKLLIKHNPFSYWDCNLTDNAQSLNNLLNQYFTLEMAEVLTNWQISVTIVEIKNLVGVNEYVYCVIEIGDKSFTTKGKHIDKLQFNDEEVKFIARVENQSLRKAFNSKITISVYFSSFYPFKPTLVGKFQTDFGTVYDHPGHSVYHQWGEILSAQSSAQVNSARQEEETFDNLTSTSGFDLKGYLKFDISLRTDNDTNKVYLDDNGKEDSDDIER